MNYEFVASLLLLVLLLSGQTFLFWKLWSRQQTQHQEERINWERERERLLNRAMTKEWQSYQQMQAALVPNFGLTSDPAEARGMSDEEELRRYRGEQLPQAQGLGETLVELHDDSTDDREFFEAFRTSE